VPTVHDSRRLIDVTIVEDLNRMEENNLTRGGVIFKPIRSDIKIKTAQIKRKLLLESFPSCKAAEDFKHLANDILKQIEIDQNKQQPGSSLNLQLTKSESFLLTEHAPSG
jgi:cellulose biosynthesis protein BcsQ